MTMDHKLALENFGSAAVCTLPNTIIYLKAVKFSNARLGCLSLLKFKIHLINRSIKQTLNLR